MSFSSEAGSEADVWEWAELFSGVPDPSSTTFRQLREFCEAHARAVDRALPLIAAEIGRNDGYGIMLDFVHRWSGMRLHVSKDHTRFVNSVECSIGEVTHQRFVGSLSIGSQIEVPSAWGVFLALRRVAVATALRSRLPHDQISRRFGVTMRSLR